MSDPAFEQAVRALAKAARSKNPPSHRHARDILLLLGAAVLAEGEDAQEERLAAIDGAVGERREPWLRAVEHELAMACNEHVQSVDPRYLDHPRYDFAYTIAARERLEARLAAASVMGIEVSEEALERVAQADRSLAPYLRERGLDAPGTTRAE